MTVVNPKSISGINSITMASGSDNLLTIHTTNTTERVRVNSDGDVIVGSGITVSPDGDIFATGVTTSTTFSGNFSGGTISGTTGTFTGDVDIADTIVHTGDTNTKIRFPAADTVTVETGGSERLRITSDGNLGIGENSPSNLLHVKVSDTGVTPHASAQIVLERYGTNYLQFLTSRTGTSGLLFGDEDDNDVAQIKYDHNIPALQFITQTGERMRIDSSGRVIIGAQITADTGGYYDDITLNNSNTASGEAGGAGLSIVSGSSSYGGVIFSRSNSHGRGYVKYDQTNDRLILGTQTTDKIMIEDNTNNGDVHIKTGNIVMDAAGKGIDFSAASGDGGGMQSELLADYEEGIYSPSLYRTSSNVSYLRNKGRYIRVGNLCFVWFDIQTSGNNSSGSGTWRVSLPFSFANNSTGTAGLNNAGHGAPSFRDMSFFTRDQGYKTSSYINGDYIDLRYINASNNEQSMIETGSDGRVTGQAWGYLSQAT